MKRSRRFPVAVSGIILAILVLGSACGNPEYINRDRSMEEALYLYKNGHLLQAEKGLERHLGHFPDDVEAGELMGWIQDDLSSQFASFAYEKCERFAKAGGDCATDIDSTLFYLENGDTATAWIFYKEANRKYVAFSESFKRRLTGIIETASENFNRQLFNETIDSLSVILSLKEDDIGYYTIYEPRRNLVDNLFEKAKYYKRIDKRRSGVSYYSSKYRWGVVPAFTVVTRASSVSMNLFDRISVGAVFARKFKPFSRWEGVIDIRFHRSEIRFQQYYNIITEWKFENIEFLTGVSYVIFDRDKAQLYGLMAAGPVFVDGDGREFFQSGTPYRDGEDVIATWPGYRIGIGFHSVPISKSIPRISYGGEASYLRNIGDKIGGHWNLSYASVDFRFFYHF